MLKYEHLMLTRAFPDKVTPYIDFKDETVVQCDVPGNLQMITYKF